MGDMARKGVSESSNASTFELNQMIEYWSKGGNVDDPSRNIAQDLLKSALKLQESLVTLGRLQEASKFLARSKKMAKPSNHGEEYEKKNVGASDTVSGFDDSNYRSLSQFNYRNLSIDGSSSMDSFRDLKSVLRDGLLDHLSSSRREHSFREVGVRAEEIGSGRFQNSIYKKRPENKLPTVNHDDSARHCIEEIKKVIKDSLVKQSLLSVSSDEDQKFSSGRRQCDVHSELHSSSPCTSFSYHPESQRKVEQPMKTSKPSNLIAKLMGLEEFPARTVQSAPQESETKKSYHRRKSVFDIQMPKVMNSPIADRVGDRGQTELKNIIESMRYKGLLRNTPTRDYSLTTRSWNATEELPPIVVIKPLPIAVNEGKERGNFLANSVVSEIKNQHLKQGVSRSVGNDIETVEAGGKNSIKSKTPAHNNIVQQRTNSFARKSNKMQNNSRDGRNLIENHNRKSSQVTNTPIKASFRQSRKPEILSVLKKNPVYKSVSTHDIDLLPSRQCLLEDSVDRAPRLGTNNGKMQRRNSAIKTAAKKKVQKEVVKGSDMTEQHNNLSIADKLAQNMVQISKESAKVCNDVEGKYPSKTGADDMPGVSFTTAQKNYDKGENVSFLASTDTHDRQLLLSNPVFLDKVEKLFGLQTEKHSYFPSSSIVSKDGKEDIILLDCAYELLERKNSETLLSSHPLLQTPLKCKCKILLDQLVDEVIEGIATWRWGTKSIDADSSRIDSPYLILGRDLMCNSMVVNGVWDVGWLNGLSVEEAEVVVNEVGKDIEGELIEEIVISLVHRCH